MSGILQDLRYALRQLRKNPGFTAIAILTLALGIGATTAVFSLVDGILLRPLPFPHADRLVAIDTLEFPPGVAPTNLAAADFQDTSYPNFFDWRRQTRTFDSLASCDYIFRLFSKADGEGARVLAGGRVSANLFPTLGVLPALGRTFAPDEEQAGHRVVILSHELWVSDFASSLSALGQSVKISDEPYTIIGVMPSGFHFPADQPAYFWTTFAIDSEGTFPGTSRRDDNRLSIVGRLKQEVGISQALAELNMIQRGLAQQYPEDRYKLGVSIVPLLEHAVTNARSALSLLLAAVGVVLIIGCANVAGLLLARANRRRPELALRTALGAGRPRILRQLFVEAFLLAAAGGTGGILLAVALLRAALRFVPDDLPRLYSVAIDGRVLAFAILLSGATALMFGLLPAWRMSQLAPANALREGGPNVTGGRHRNRLHHALVVAETALGFTLLIASGLLIRSMLNVLHLEPGFDTDHTVYFDVALTNKRYSGPSKVAFYDKLLPEIAALPGVERVGSGHPLPILGGRGTWTNFTIAGRLNSQDAPSAAGATVATPGYFETLSIPLVRGRTFAARDNDPKAAPVAVINQSFARRYFPAEDPIGRTFTPKFEYTNEPVLAREIVGIVGDTRTNDMWDPYQPQFFLPYAQDPTHQRPIVVLKVSGDPLSYQNMARKIVADLDKDAPVFGYRTFTDEIDVLAQQPRFEALLVSAFAGIALLLSAVGLYAVLSYIVAERTREIGLRMALGASRSDVLRSVLKRGLALACAGIGLGLSVSVFATRLLADMLFNAPMLDRTVLWTVTLVLLFVSIAAAFVPAVRAANVDPMATLRNE